MKTITINGNKVKITIETYKRIIRFAAEKKIAFSDAVSFCLKKVI